ncbi:MAG: DeoR family transcriptional regulator [Spirochaetales bacterium]|nr:DeoR family transcriptional regulator [Spirochaetales bacterium]
MENLNERKREILHMLAEDSEISVTDISKSLRVSTVTIRSDLSSLEENGYIVRTRGGALPAFHKSILDRQRTMIHEKMRIAKGAASLVKDGDTIMVEAGTTTALVARFLLGKRDVHVVTNSTLLLRYGRTNPSLNLTVTGGEFNPMTESFVGSMTLRELEQFHVRLAFVGTDGFSIENGLTTHLSEGAEIVRMMASRSDETILLADSGKFGRAGFARVIPLEEIDAIITDSSMGKQDIDLVEGLGIKIYVS